MLWPKVNKKRFCQIWVFVAQRVFKISTPNWAQTNLALQLWGKHMPFNAAKASHNPSMDCNLKEQETRRNFHLKHRQHGDYCSCNPVVHCLFRKWRSFFVNSLQVVLNKIAYHEPQVLNPVLESMETTANGEISSCRDLQVGNVEQQSLLIPNNVH